MLSGFFLVLSVLALGAPRSGESSEEGDVVSPFLFQGIMFSKKRLVKSRSDLRSREITIV